MITLKSANPEIRALTGMRFVAALYVFLFHIHIRWPLTSQPFFKNVLDQGAIGMSLFFVLSGFVLAYQYSDRPTKYTDYLVNRFARIYPIYFLAAVVTVPWIGITFGDFSASDIIVGCARIFLLVLANILLIQAWFPQFFPLWNDGGSWSISVEAFCYLLLPFAIAPLIRLGTRWLSIAIASFFLLAALPGLSVWLFETTSAGVFYHMPIFRLSEFLCGVAVYLVARNWHIKRIGPIYQAAVIVGFIVYLGILGHHLPIYVGHNWIALPAITFLIFSISNGYGPIACLLSNRLFVWLGRISYCFYSFQAFLILFLIDYHQRLVVSVPVLSNNLILTGVSFAWLILVSAAAHHFIEEPCRRWIRNKNSFHRISARRDAKVPA